MDDFLALLDETPETLTPATIEQIPTYDLSIFEEFHSKAGDLEALVILGFGEIQNDDDNKEAVQTNHLIKQLIKAIEEERKRAKEPYYKVVKLIDSNVKTLRDKLDGIQSILNSKIKEYLEKQQQQIIEKMAITVSNDNNDNSVMPEILPAVTVTDSGATAKLATKTEWTITDFKALPDECFKEREEQITKAIAPYINRLMKEGITQISGVIFTETTILKTK